MNPVQSRRWASILSFGRVGDKWLDIAEAVEAVDGDEQQLPGDLRDLALKAIATASDATGSDLSVVEADTTKDALTRAMICLYVDPAVAELIAAPMQDMLSGVTVEPPEDLHITLAYFPDVDVTERDELLACAARASTYWSPITTEIEGAAQFFAEEDDPTPYVLLVDPDKLQGLRSDVMMNCGECRPSRSHGFIPHITLAYLLGDVAFSPPDIPELPLTFNKITVKFGDGTRHDFTLGSPPMLDTYRALDLSEEIDAVSTSSETPEQQSTVPTTDTETMTDAMNTTDTDKAGKRMAGSMRERLSGALGTIKEVLGWADYEDEESEEDMQVKMLNEDGNLLVFKDNFGVDRWLSYSSNAFKDREKEIVSTKFLMDAVEYADKTGDRGPLRLFHIPGADIGTCDFQGVQGRFLIESGTFLDTPMALAGKAYIQTCPEELGVSIGFRHPVDAKKDGVYDEGIIKERSVCPLIFAANPFTAFITMKGDSMESIRTDWLKKAIGEEFANDVLSKADAATKALEGQVAFKDDAAILAAIETLKAVAPSDEAKGALDTLVLSFAAPAEKAETPAVETAPVAEAIATALTPISEAMSEIAKAIAGINTKVDGVAASVEAVSTRVEATETSLKTLPAGAGAFRASTSPATVLSDQDAVKDAIGDSPAPPSPVQTYVDQVRKALPV